MDFDKELSRIVGELGGATSVCWQPKPTGVFDSEQASKHVDEALAAIKQLIESKQPEKREPVDEEQPNYEMKVASNNMTMGYNAAIDAWRRGMGLS